MFMKCSGSFRRFFCGVLMGFAFAFAPNLGAQDTAPGRLVSTTPGSGLPVVGLKVVRGETIEPSPLSRVAPAEVAVYRDGPATNELTVFLAIEGSATPGVDYGALEKFVKFSAGQAKVSLLIGALDDSLVEGDETVVIVLSTSPADRLPTYTIDPSASAAKIVIHDNDVAPNATIKITRPSYGAELPAGLDLEIDAEAVDPESYISTLEFYVDGTFLDRSVITFIRAPDPGTPIHHSVNWKSPIPGKHELVARGEDSHGVIVSSEPVIVVVNESSSGTLVSIKALDPIGTELPPFVDAIDPIVFEVSRTGPTAGDLVVFFSLHGTASKDDYFDLPTSIIIPNGSASAKLQIVPKSDLLEVVEPMETVGVQLEPSPMAGPLRTYEIDPSQRRAAGVIFERKTPEGPVVELVWPDRGTSFELGELIELVAASYVPGGFLMVDFYDGDEKIGSSLGTVQAPFDGPAPVSFHQFSWKGATAGEHIVTARSTMADGKQVVSSPFMIAVKDSGVTPAYIKISEPGEGQMFPVGSAVSITAVAVDPQGYIPSVEFFANDQRIGVSELAFFRAPDPGTPITHNFIWENAPAGEYVLTVRGVDAQGRGVTSFPVKVAVGPGGGDGGQVVLAVEAIDPTASETTEIPDNAVFVVRRVSGPKDVDVPFTFSLTGTAINGVDYTEVSEKNILRAGQGEVEIVIQPIADKAIEGDELIELTLQPPVCVKIFPPPPDCYLIGKPGSARAVLRDSGDQPANASIELLWPKSGEFFEAGSDMKLGAVARDPKGSISRVEFYANDKLVDVSEIVFVRAPDPGTPITHTAVWEKVPAGEYAISARGVDAQGQIIVSQPAKISVGTGGSSGGGGGGDLNQVVIMVEALDPVAGETTDADAPDTAAFVIRRIAGAKDVEVPISFKLSGDAVNGIDYAEVKEQVVLPAGAESVKVVIDPIADNLTEPEEVVELTLLPVVCAAVFPPPPQCYLIAKSESARVVIRDHSTGTEELLQPKVAILPPSDTTKSLREQPLQIQADAAAIKGKACTLESTTDLKTWSPVAPVFLPDGQLTYLTAPGVENQRYYRLRVQ
jgi:hypothetical protein